MKDYYSLFIELSLQQCAKNDFTNKFKVRHHNAALRKLKQLQTEMMQNDCEEILHMLLSHKDNRVRVNAADLCLQMNILVKQAVLVLENIAEISDDPTMCFSAEMLLKDMAAKAGDGYLS